MSIAENIPTEELRTRIRSLGPWFHNLRLGGIETAPEHFLGDYPSFKWQSVRHLVPEDLCGRTVLDIGCNAGFYSMEMKRRGAARVVGVDSDPRYLAQARFAAEVEGLEIEFRQLSVYELGGLGRFDFVVFMGVLYHLRHPLLALDLLYEKIVGEALLFQSMLRGTDRIADLSDDYSFDHVEVFEREDYPRLAFIERRYAGDPTNWWVPNRAGMEAMLRSSGFTIEQRAGDDVYLCRRGERLLAPEFYAVPPLI